jgi:hypothetical protein
MHAPAHPAPLPESVRIVWRPVKCPHCGKMATEAAPGSVVKVDCKRCKQTSAVAIAA